MFFELDKTNPLFQLANTAKRKPHFLAAAFLSFLFIIIGQFIGYGIVNLIPDDLFSSKIWNTAFNSFKEILLFFLPSIFIVAIWLKFYEKRAFSTIGFSTENALKKIVFGFLFGITMFSVAILFLYLFNDVAVDSSSKSYHGFEMLLPTLLILTSYLVQGSTEEIVFRGWLLPIIGIKLNPWIAILISSILFALLHGLNDNITILALVNLLLFGIFISLFALRQGSIWGVCAWHAIWNWLQGNFYGLEVSGNQENITVIDLKETGSDWITGGKFGPEGGFIVTIILLLGIAILFIIKNKSSNNQKI
jgi:uncharacterized protein